MKQSLIGLVMCLMRESAVGVHEQPPRQRRGSESVPKVYRLEELTWTQIDGLDRQRTLVVLPVGMLEQHGPHLPIGSDTIGATHEAEAASRRVSRALPDWQVVVMPAVHCSAGLRARRPAATIRGAAGRSPQPSDAPPFEEHGV